MTHVIAVLKSWSKVTDKVTCCRLKGLVTRNTHANMKDLSVKVKMLWPMLKFFDGRTDRVITIGHPPSGGPLNISLVKPKCDTEKSRKIFYLDISRT